MLVTADLRLEGEALRITAQDVARWTRRAGAGAGMRVWLERTEAVPHIRALLGRERGARGGWCWCRVGGPQSVEIALPGGFNVTPRLAQALKVLPGVERVEEV